MSRASGKGGLNYSATLNIEELKKKSEEALKLFKRLQEESAKVIKVNVSSQAPNTKALTAFQEARIAATKTLLNAQLASEKLRQENLLLDTDLKAGRITAQQAAAATKANTLARQELVRSTKEGRLAQVAANGSYDEANKKLIALGRSIKAAEGGFKSTNPAIRAQIQEYNQLNRSLKDFDSSLGNHQRNVGNYGGALNGVIGSLSGMAAGFLSATAILQSAFDTALKTDAIRTSLEFTFNSSDIAQTKMEGLEKTARRLGLEYTSLADSYRAFAGAAVASNFSLKETDKIFNSVANAGAKLKLTSDQVSGALKALEQMISKGNVQSEELKGQLGERLPGAFAIAARAMGVTTMELNKMLKDGKVLAEDLLPKLADELDKTFSNDKTEKVKSLQGEVNNLKNSFTEIVETKGALSALFTFVVGMAGKATEGIAKLSQALGIYYDLLTDGKKFIGDSLKVVRNEALEELKAGAAALAKDIPKEVNGKSGLYDRLNQEKKALRDLTKEYEAAKIVYEKTKSSDRNLTDTKAIHALEENQQYQIFLVKSLRKEYENLYGDKGIPKLIEDSALKSIKAIQTRINELKKLDGSATEGSDIYKRIEALQARLKKSPVRSGDAEVNAQRTLQSEIDSLTKKGRNKQLDADAQELADVDEKYEKLFEKAKKFNDSVASYNKDPKNKNKKIGVNTSGLLNAQATESDVTRDKQATAILKVTLDEQKKLYDEYENYKEKLGVDQANKLASGKIDAEKTYLKYLESEESRLLGVDDKGKGSDGGGVRNEQQLKLVREEIKVTKEAKEKADKEMYAEAYLAAETFAQKELAIRKKYNEQLDALLKKQNGKVTDEQRKNLDQAKDSAINAAKDEALAKTDIYKRLAEETLIMTREQVKEQAKALKGVMDAGGMSEADKQKIKDRIGDLEITLKIGVDQVNLDNLKAEYQDTLTELNSVDQDGNIIISEESKKRIIKRLEEIQAKIDGIDSNGDGVASWGDKVAENFKYLKGDTQAVAEGVSKDLGQLSSGFNELSNAFGGADTQAGYLMGTIGDLAKVGSDAAGAVAGFASGDIIGGITKTISAVAGIFSMGKKVKDMNLKARKEVSDFYADAIKGETEYQVLLRKRELNTVARGKNSYKAIVAQLEAIKRQSPEIQKAYDNIFNSLQGQESVEGMGYKHGTLFRKAKTWDIMASLAGSDYTKLEQLYLQGKLKDAAKADFESLKALKDELEAAGISAEDLQKQLGELLTGTSTSGLADGLKALFENGKTSAQDFGDSFEAIMKNSIMNTFKAKYLDDALQPFYDELAAMMGGSTPTEDQIAALKAKYVQIGKEADGYLDNIQKITGQDLSDKGNQSALKSNNTLTASVNQPTAERLEGLWRGNFDLTKQLVVQSQAAGLTMGEMLQVGRSKLAALERIDANTMRGANNTDGHTDLLNEIIKNTKPQKSTRD